MPRPTALPPPSQRLLAASGVAFTRHLSSARRQSVAIRPGTPQEPSAHPHAKSVPYGRGEADPAARPPHLRPVRRHIEGHLDDIGASEQAAWINEELLPQLRA